MISFVDLLIIWFFLLLPSHAIVRNRFSKYGLKKSPFSMRVYPHYRKTEYYAKRGKLVTVDMLMFLGRRVDPKHVLVLDFNTGWRGNPKNCRPEHQPLNKVDDEEPELDGNACTPITNDLFESCGTMSGKEDTRVTVKFKQLEENKCYWFSIKLNSPTHEMYVTSDISVRYGSMTTYFQVKRVRKFSGWSYIMPPTDILGYIHVDRPVMRPQQLLPNKATTVAIYAEPASGFDKDNVIIIILPPDYTFVEDSCKETEVGVEECVGGLDLQTKCQRYDVADIPKTSSAARPSGDVGCKVVEDKHALWLERYTAPSVPFNGFGGYEFLFKVNVPGEREKAGEAQLFSCVNARNCRAHQTLVGYSSDDNALDYGATLDDVTISKKQKKSGAAPVVCVLFGVYLIFIY